MPDMDDGLPGLAHRLDLLFRTVPSASGEFYTNESAAQELSASGVPVSGAHLAAMRTGKRNNPSARLIAAVAELFEVPVTYFFDAATARRVESQINVLTAMQSAGVQTLVARSAGLSETGIANLTAILEQLRQIEGLYDAQESSLPSQADLQSRRSHGTAAATRDRGPRDAARQPIR